MIYNTTATIASVVVFGWLLMLAGVMQFVHAFQVTEWKGFEMNAEATTSWSARSRSPRSKHFTAIVDIPDMAIRRDLLRARKRSRCSRELPRSRSRSMVKAGAVSSGAAPPMAGNPVYLRAGGTSWGPADWRLSTDYFLLLMNVESVEGLMKARFELGGEAAVAGLWGRNTNAGTDALVHAAILSYSRSRRVFADANLKGVVVRPEDDLNRAVYDQTDRANSAAPSDGLKAFPEELGRATANAGSDRWRSHDHQRDRLAQASSRRDGGCSPNALARDLGGSLILRRVRRRCDSAAEAHVDSAAQGSLN